MTFCCSSIIHNFGFYVSFSVTNYCVGTREHGDVITSLETDISHISHIFTAKCFLTGMNMDTLTTEPRTHCPLNQHLCRHSRKMAILWPWT